MNRINVTKPSMPPYEEYIREIKELWDSQCITNNGVKTRKFQSDLSEFFCNENISLFTNGHSALEAAIEGLELEGEIITTPFTFISTVNAIARRGLKPVFCDIKEENFTLEPNNIEALINRNTSAIMPVHVYGNVCDYVEIERIAQKYNLKVIYDAAHAFGVKKNNVNVANMGDITMFSFHATKVFNTIEGGALSFKDERLIQKFNYIKNFGIENEENIEYIGGNSKMNEFQAAMGICNLRHINNEIKKRKNIDKLYRFFLSDIKGIKLNKIDIFETKNYSYFPVVFDGYRFSRDEIIEKLSDKNIFARKYFYPIANEFKIYRDISNSTPVAKYYSEHILTLPMYSDMTIDNVKQICDIILS